MRFHAILMPEAYKKCSGELCATRPLKGVIGDGTPVCGDLWGPSGKGEN